MSDCSGSNEESGVESVEEGTWVAASSSSDSGEDEETGIENTEIDVVPRRGADVSLNIHGQLDLAKLQQIKDIFFANGGSDATPELDIRQFNTALRTVLDDTEDMTDEDLGVLFMKIDANGSGSVDWDEFTGFLLQLDEGNRNMAAAAHMVDLRPLPGCTQIQRAGSTAAQHKGMVEKVINVERPGISAYVTCGRDGTIRFWHKGTFAHLRSIDHLDTIKTACGALIHGSQGFDGEGGARCTSTAPARRALNTMKSAWVSDIQQMPLGNRLAATCLDRSVSFYEMLTGEFVCRIAGLSSVPTCVECVQVNPNEQLVLFGDLEGVLHFWSFGRHFFIPGPMDAGEATDLHGNDSLKVHNEAVSCMSHVPDLNAAVTCGVDGKVHFIDLARRRILRTFGGHGDRAVFALCYCQQHRFVASAGMGREVVFWNPYTMHVLARGNGHSSTVKHCLIDDRSGRIITVSTDKAVRCWDSATLRCIQSFKDSCLHRPEDSITAALWDDSKSSLILVGSDMRVWKNKGAIQTTTRSHEAPVTTALYNKHFHQVVSGDVMGNVQVWLVETGQLAFRFAGAHGESKISSMCFDALERRLLTGANDGTVKMWNFSNGKVLQGFGPSATPGRKIEEGSEVSGVVYCRENRGGSDQVSMEYIVTSSWDRVVRVFSDDDSREGGLRPAHASWDEEPRPPSRAFPLRRAGGGGDLEGHSADILAIAHCGHQQVATGGFDGQIFIWAADSGKVRFSMRPSDHDISEGVDDVSSIGGFTGVARLMERQRKEGLMTDGDSIDSGGYLERMEDLLADDQSAAKPVWDGREFFAEERMGGNDDGSGTAVAAETPAPGHENVDADGSAAGEHDNEAAAAAAGDVVSSSPGGGGGGAKTDKKKGDGRKEENEDSAAAAAAAAAATDPQGEKIVAEEHPPPEPSSTFAMADNNTDRDKSESPVGDGDGPGSYVGNGEGTAAISKAGGSIRRSLSSRLIAHGPGVGLTDAVAVTDEEQERSSKQENMENCGRGGEELKRSPKVDGRGDVGGARGHQVAGKSATRKLDGGDSVLLKTDDPKANVNVADSAVERLENAASHTVDCLLFIRCHGMLVSGTASGELHFWDTATGALIFGAKAQHPSNAGISALSCSEGGTVDSEDAGGGGNTIACSGAAAAAEIANLALYTACEEGYVKTWKLGDVSEHLYQTGRRARPKSERKHRLGRGGRPTQSRAACAASASAAGMGTETGNTSVTRRQSTLAAADFTALPGDPKPNITSNRGPVTGLGLGLGHKALLVPLRQWRAHETRVSSVGGANYRGKADLLVTAGVDCYVHLWTVAGSFVGTFGQLKGLWSLGSRATWRESADQTLLNTRGSFSEADDQTTTVGEEQSAARTERGERRLQGKATAGTSGGGASPPRRYRMPDARSKADTELALERAKEETRRYQEQRYYLASQNRVQRKLLRGRLGAFCMSRDYDKQALLQEASSILQETAKKNTPHLAGGSSRPGLNKNRITSILRNTYNQVSFQLRLHQGVDVNQVAEGTLAKRRSRRRQKQQQANNAPTTTAPNANAANRQGHQRPATTAPPVGLDIAVTAPTTPAGTQNTTSGSKNCDGKNGAASRPSSLRLSPAAIAAMGGEAGGASPRMPRRPGGGDSLDKCRDAGISDPIAIEERGSTRGGGREDLRGGGRGPKDAGGVRPATAIPSRPALPGSSTGAGRTSFRRLSAAGSGGSREEPGAIFAPLT